MTTPMDTSPGGDTGLAHRAREKEGERDGDGGACPDAVARLTIGLETLARICHLVQHSMHKWSLRADGRTLQKHDCGSVKIF